MWVDLWTPNVVAFPVIFKPILVPPVLKCSPRWSHGDGLAWSKTHTIRRIGRIRPKAKNFVTSETLLWNQEDRRYKTGQQMTTRRKSCPGPSMPITTTDSQDEWGCSVHEIFDSSIWLSIIALSLWLSQEMLVIRTSPSLASWPDLDVHLHLEHRIRQQDWLSLLKGSSIQQPSKI